MQEGMNKRLENELKRINAALRNKKLPENWLYLGPHIESSNLPNYNKIDFCWRGVSGNMKGGVYNAEFDLEGDLNSKPPKVKILNEFRHLHVYGHGRVCFPYCDQKWRSSNTLIDVASELEMMLELPPDISSPAHYGMRDLFNKS